MTQEEKAKAYDELFVKVKQIYNKENDVLILHTIEDLFPELKESESEDERIRKSLIDWFSDTHAADDFRGIAWERIVAWLEKQKVSINKVEPKFKVGDKIQYLKGCGTIMTIKKIENGEYIFDNNMGHTTIENGNKCYLVNSVAWSEKDEKYLKLTIDNFQTLGNSFLTAWLKSLKDRVQPKQEWSEEDERYLSYAIYAVEDMLGNNGKNTVTWLKSLKDRYPWKPSDEQLYALNKVKLIRAEIERRLEKLSPDFMDYYDYDAAKAGELESILFFIDSLEENPKDNVGKEENQNKELENEIVYLSKIYPEVSFAKLSRIAVHMVKWQRKRENDSLN